MKYKPLYLELSVEDRALLDRLAADSGAVEGRPVRLVEVVRRLVRDAARRKTPLRVSEGRAR
jgi:hypothetical protein